MNKKQSTLREFLQMEWYELDFNLCLDPRHLSVLRGKENVAYYSFIKIINQFHHLWFDDSHIYLIIPLTNWQNPNIIR